MVTINLQKDAADIRAMPKDGVRRYSSEHGDKPVTRIDLAFSLGDGESIPWVHLNLDTKPGSEPDGDPTHPGFAKLNREAWLPAVQAVCEEQTVTVHQPNGSATECGGAELSSAIGTFLVDAIIAARGEGVLVALPKADHCELGVEDLTTGEFGWPTYDDRGKLNLVT